MKKLCLIVLVALFGLAVSCPPASAAGRLVSSTPAAGARLPKAPETVRLTFDRPVLGGGANVVTVTGPDGKPWGSGAMGIDDNVVTAILSPQPPHGDYVVDYTIRLGEPSPLTGQLRFTFAEPGSSGGMSWQTWASLAAIALGIVALLTFAGVRQARARR
ncbi:copper resistance CopC family protein [Lentzea sp. NPDC004789]